MKILFILLSLLIAVGCSVVNEKQTAGSESVYLGPWASPGLRSEELLRERLSFYSPTGVTTAYWSINGGRIDASAVIDSVAKYLIDLGYFSTWPKGGMGFDDIPSRCIAPYHFFIISIQPTVVIMAARLDGDPVHGVGQNPPRQNRSTTTKYFENSFEYGSDFVDRPKLLWFSPDLHVPPRAIDVDRHRGHLQIEHPKVSIQAILESGIWRSERLK